MIYVGASNPFEAVLEAGITGLVGTLAVEIVDNDGNIVFGPTTANIAEEATTGVYMWNNAAAPATLGQYTIIWSTDGTFDEGSVAAEDLVIVTATAGPLPPIPPPEGGGLSFGPCSAWITGDDVAACCGIEVSSGAMFDDAADQASQLLFELSGRQFAGLCSRTVRPACDDCNCGYQVLSRGYVIGPWDYGYPLMLCDSCMIACSPSRVKLAGYPVREITTVKIDGDTVDPSLYTLWNNRYLTRLDSHHWPWSQNLTLPDTDDNTFSIEYTYGQSPPLMGAAAAAQLACELYRSCVSATGGECALPLGVTRLVRQGVTIDKLAFISWTFRDHRWQTGLPTVDAFLSTYNPNGIQRRPTLWAPGKRQYAQPYG